MARMDDLMTDLTNRRISRRTFVAAAAAAGISAPLLKSGGLSVMAQETRNSVVWVSPRGTLEVLDDYPVLGRQEVRLFRRHRNRTPASNPGSDLVVQVGR